MSDVDTIEAGKSAWQRIKGQTRPLFEDWLTIGRALIAGRAQIMTEAGSNTPHGLKYNRLTREWLGETGLDEIDSHQRTSAVKMVENEIEIRVWRDGLPEASRLRANHPTVIVGYWRKGIMPQKTGPKPKPSNFFGHGRRGTELNRPGQDTIRRIANAMRSSGKADYYGLATVAIEALTEDDIIALLKPKKRASAQSIKAESPAAACRSVGDRGPVSQYSSAPPQPLSVAMQYFEFDRS
jgi:hypothetical protein